MKRKWARSMVLVAVLAVLVIAFVPTHLLGNATSYLSHGAVGEMYKFFKPSKLKMSLCAGAAAHTDFYVSGIRSGDEVLYILELTGTGTVATLHTWPVPDSLYNVETDSIALHPATSGDSLLVFWCDSSY